MADRLAVFSVHFLENLEHWARTDRKLALRLVKIIRETIRNPQGGIGKPKALKRGLAGLWSRRLTLEHRVVYEVTPDAVRFLQARYHY